MDAYGDFCEKYYRSPDKMSASKQFLNIRAQNENVYDGLLCVGTSYNRPLSNGLMAFLMLSIMYSFGTFGFLNLFGIRQWVQFALIGLILYLCLIMRPQCKARVVYPVLAFAGMYALGGVVNGGQSTGPIEAFILVFIVYAIYSARPNQVVFLAKALVVSTSLFCILVSIAYGYYKINPDQLSTANLDIYDSTIGNSQIYPGNLIDWISFTSGDGFVFGGEINTRMKGYSNEPSSTVVHYLAPAIFAFAIGGLYSYLGLFVVFVNIVAIGSFTSHIIVLLSFVIFLLAKLFRRNLSLLYVFISVLMMVTILSPTIMLGLFEFLSGLAISYFDFDLISRKIGGDSLEGRNAGMVDGLYSILISPLGYSSAFLGSGAGLLYVISAFAGWIGVILFAIFIYKMVALASFVFAMKNSTMISFSLCLFFSLLLIVLFVSGYGWSRPPGVIILMLIYRMMEVLSLSNKIP